MTAACKVALFAFCLLHSQAHLLSIFDNVKTVTFHEKQYNKILAINSREPETIEVHTHTHAMTLPVHIDV